MRSIELFAGAGGLAIGTSMAGFRHERIVEWDKDACETLRANRRRKVYPANFWPPVEPMDVRALDLASLRPEPHLVSGGVPCQPWSQGGKHKGFRDDRNLFPSMVDVVRALQPKSVLIENVKGLTRKLFANYFEYIKHQIRYPEIVQRSGESWLEHLRRLEQHHTSGSRQGLHYHLVARLLNAADFGVPQKRERVFIVAFRADLEIEWAFPEATHSQEALLHDQFVTGEYWERHKVAKRKRPTVPLSLLPKINGLSSSFLPPTGLPWQTVRDAISDLPEPESPAAISVGVLNHTHNPGARSYPGHTGSPFDEPSKTLKAGVHGVPGGENTVLFPDGALRYLTVREAARIQTFPDNYLFDASWTESMRQLGNAVPVKLAHVVARDIATHLKRTRKTA